MNKPVITLKNIQYMAKLSEETPCYSATLYVDGVKTLEVANAGHGGSDNVAPTTNTSPLDAYAAYAELDTLIAKTYPAEPYDFGDNGKGEFPASLEVLCHTLLYDHLERKHLKRELKRTLLAADPKGDIYTYKIKPTVANMDMFQLNKPDHILLNRLNFDEAVRLLVQNT